MTDAELFNQLLDRLDIKTVRAVQGDSIFPALVAALSSLVDRIESQEAAMAAIVNALQAVQYFTVGEDKYTAKINLGQTDSGKETH